MKKKECLSRIGDYDMRIPTLTKANDLLEDASRLNPGPWISHSLNTAMAAKLIAKHDSSLDPEAAYILGLLHDIGRRVGFTFYRHTLDGYNFLNSLGYTDAARICMTHAHNTVGKWDCTDEEYSFAKSFFSNIEFNDYDLLIQLCDALGHPSGFCLMEKRFFDSMTNYKDIISDIINDMIDVWKELFDTKAYFEKRIGCSVYSLLPGVIENTFGISSDELVTM